MSSSGCEVKELSWNGFPALAISNSRVRAVIVPTLGAKIVSLVHRNNDGLEREWLWTNPYLEPQLPDFGTPYWEEFDLGGWNECFPSIAATHFPSGPWEGSQVPEYGELWCQPWKAKVSESETEVEVRTVTYGVRFPYRFERSIRIKKDDPSIHISYTVNNLTIFPFNFLWSAQPVFDVRPGMGLNLGVQEMTVYYSEDKRYGHLGSMQMWPTLQAIDDDFIDLSEFPTKDANMAVKLFAKAPRSVALKDPATNSELVFDFSAGEITHLCLWLNFGGWSGIPKRGKYYNVIVAPCIGAFDDLRLAVNHFNQFAQIQPKNLKTWSVTVGFRNSQ